tara:strand:- start:772 stop:1470 length:699 start_codon:yes stop_codon:yes gene_type:complete
MNKNHIVIAYYNENLNWIKKIDRNKFDIFIYNKSSKNISINIDGINIETLENIGRESHTYLFHIIKYYNLLPDLCIFLQGNPFPHSIRNLINELNNINVIDMKFKLLTKNRLFLNLKDDFLNESGILNNKTWNNNHNLNSSCIPLTLFELFENIKENKYFSTCFGPGALFLVNKELILKNKFCFYNKCINILLNSRNITNPPEGHAFERLWYYIFNHNYRDDSLDCPYNSVF